MPDNPRPQGPSDKLKAHIANCNQLMQDAMDLGSRVEAFASRLAAQQALISAEIASRIADDGNCYFSATGAEHGRALQGKPD